MIFEMVNGLKMYIICRAVFVEMLVLCLQLWTTSLSVFKPKLSFASTVASACRSENLVTLASLFDSNKSSDKSIVGWLHGPPFSVKHRALGLLIC
jgi:hypothetical protein